MRIFLEAFALSSPKEFLLARGQTDPLWSVMLRPKQVTPGEKSVFDEETIFVG
jgi:hypothetical protein